MSLHSLLNIIISQSQTLIRSKLLYIQIPHEHGLHLIQMSSRPPAAQPVARKRHATPRAAHARLPSKEAPKRYQKKRSLSVERSHFPPPGRLRTGNLRSTSQLVTGHPGPEAEDSQSGLSAFLKTANSHMKAGEHAEALAIFRQLYKQQPSPQFLYKQNLCLISMGLHREAIPSLLSLIKSHPSFSKQSYSALSMSFLSVGDSTSAIRYISKGLARFPKFCQGFVIRGQLYNKQLKWDKAISDFYKASDLNPSDGVSFLGLADSLIGMGDRRNALKMLSKAVSCKNTHTQALVKRARLLFDLQDLKSALLDLNGALLINPQHAEAWYHKAMVFFVQDDLVEAALCLEQVLKFDSEKQLTGAAIYNLGTIKVKQRDFYGASHTFKRACSAELPEQQVLQGFVEAVLSLIKRHFKEGIDQLTAIIRKRHPLLRDYISKCLAYRGFGYASIEKHELAVKDFVRSNKLEPLDPASEYNFLVSQGVLSAAKDAEKASEIFRKAATHIANSSEPLVYQAAILLKKDPVEALKLLDKAVAMREEDSDLHFFRAVTKYCLKQAVEAVPDLDIAIDKAEDNVPEHFLLKGLCYAQLKLYQEAMQEFSIVLQLDEKHGDALLYRGRCAFLLEDTDAAFADYQALILLRPEDPMVHVSAGDLLMNIGSIRDAVQAYQNANESKETPLAYLQQSKCHLLLNDLPSALSSLTRVLQLDQYPACQFDKAVLQVLNKAHSRDSLTSSLQNSVRALSKLIASKQSGQICSSKQVLLYKGVMLFYLGEFKKAHSDFKSALQQGASKEQTELLYNLALCSLMGGSYKEAIVQLHEIVFGLQDKDRGRTLLLMGLLQIGLGHNEEARQLMTEAYKYDPDTVNGYLEEKENTKVLPLSSTSRYAAEFPMALATIGKCHPVLIRPAFRLPQPDLSDMELGVDKKALELFSVKTVKSKPEAPWLNRVKGSIQFTEDVLNDIVEETVSETEESEEEQSPESSGSDLVQDKRCRSAINLAHNGSGELRDYFNKQRAEELSDDSSDLFEFQ